MAKIYESGPVAVPDVSSVPSVPGSVPVVTPIGSGSVVSMGGIAPSKIGGAIEPFMRPVLEDVWGPRVNVPVGGERSIGEARSGGVPAIGLKISTMIDGIRRKIVEAREFPPFRVTLWKRGRDGPLNEAMRQGGLADVDIPVGLYIVTFNTPDEKPYASDKPIPFQAGGKEARIERVRVYPDGRTVASIRLLQNPIPILILIGAAAVGLGIAGFGVASAVESIDRVVVDTTDAAVRVALIGGVGFLGYVALRKARVF